MSTEAAKYLLTLITCSKCPCVLKNERVYVDGMRVCHNCAGGLGKINSHQEIIKSRIWTSICERVLQLNTAEYMENIKDTPRKKLKPLKRIRKKLHNLNINEITPDLSTSENSSNSCNISKLVEDEENTNTPLAASDEPVSVDTEFTNISGNLSSNKISELADPENKPILSAHVNKPVLTNTESTKAQTNSSSNNISELLNQEDNIIAFSGDVDLVESVSTNKDAAQIPENSELHNEKFVKCQSTENERVKETIPIYTESIQTSENVIPSPSNKAFQSNTNQLSSISLNVDNDLTDNSLSINTSNVALSKTEKNMEKSELTSSNIENNCDETSNIPSLQLDVETNKNVLINNISESVDSNNDLFEKALKCGIVNFFNTEFGSSLIKEYAEVGIPKNSSFSDDKRKEHFESVIQQELQYFFHCENGKMLLKTVVTDAIQTLMDRQVVVMEQENVTDSSVLANIAGYESDNDMFVPPTPPVKTKSTFISSIMATSVSIETSKILNEFAHYFDLKICSDLFTDTECLVSDSLQHTRKWIFARCKGIPIVTSQWMIDSLEKGYMLALNNYLWEPSFSIPPFFKTLDIIVCPPLPDLETQEWMELLKMAGARVKLPKDWLPGPVHLKRVIVCNVDMGPNVLESMMVFYRAPAVLFSYLAKMISDGVLDNIDNHLIYYVSPDELTRMGFPCADDQHSVCAV